MVGIQPKIVCIAGSLQPHSRTERLTRWCTTVLTQLGAEVSVFAGSDIDFPHYRALPSPRTEPVQRLLAEMRESDGVLVASPAYHGTVSGVLKNALDYVNDLGGQARPFLDGRPVGCVAVASGEQGAASTLATLRTIAHALRGWPTPLGVTASDVEFDGDGMPTDERLTAQGRVMLGQILTLSVPNARRRAKASRPSTVRGEAPAGAAFSRS